MNDRYLGKVVKTPDNYSVVVNIGSDHNVRVGHEFLVVGIGETIVDPDTGEVLEQLEIVRGKVAATHVQQKISTLSSIEVERDPDVKEVKRKPTGGYNAYSNIFGEREAVTEVTKMGSERQKPLMHAQTGDYILKI